VKNPNWDPKTDPGRTQYPDSYNMKFTEDTSKIDQIVMADSGASQTTLTFDNLAASDFGQAMQSSSDRVVLGSTPCTYYWAPDMRKITDIRVRKALGYAYPYVDAWKAGGEIVNVTRKPGTSILPPGIPGRVNYDVLGNGGSKTDPAKAKALLKQAGKLGYVIKFLYVSNDPLAVAAKDQIVKGLTAAGFKPSPVAVGINQYPTVRADPNANINVRSAGWCSDWPTGLTWIPPLFSSTGSYNLSFFHSKDIDNRIKKILVMPLTQQPHAWGELDKYIETKYYVVVNTGYAGVAMMHGSKIHGMYDDNTVGMPTWKNIYVK
jgi:peptide/nickel transport system substrate-binding protein